MGSFPGILMGIVWEAYHKGVPLLRVPGITLDTVHVSYGIYIYNHLSRQAFHDLERIGEKDSCCRKLPIYLKLWANW